MGSHSVRTHWMYQYCVLYLAWWWFSEPKQVAVIFNFNINYLYMLCYWLNKLLYYCKTQRDGSYRRSTLNWHLPTVGCETLTKEYSHNWVTVLLWHCIINFHEVYPFKVISRNANRPTTASHCLDCSYDRLVAKTWSQCF